jgi:hypothetical protein
MNTEPRRTGRRLLILCVGALSTLPLDKYLWRVGLELGALLGVFTST